MHPRVRKIKPATLHDIYDSTVASKYILKIKGVIYFFPGYIELKCAALLFKRVRILQYSHVITTVQYNIFFG